MKTNFSYILSLLFIILFAGCKDKNNEPEAPDSRTSILLYAVASNSLSSDFYSDISEIKTGLQECDLSKVDFYVYNITKKADTHPTLSKATKNNLGKIDFEVIKDYDRDIYSTSQERISQVISDYLDLTSADVKGLILWSHATAWAPAPERMNQRMAIPDNASANSATSNYSSDTDTLGEISSISASEAFWWGQDINNSVADYCNVTDLAATIPDHEFDFIWFDCCYMSSIEVIYQMRNKARRFVAYPTEVLAEGAPYQIITPYIARQKPDLLKAADAVAQYFISGNKVFTIAVINPDALEKIADIASATASLAPAPANTLIKYSRGGYYFYDFGQYINSKFTSDPQSQYAADFKEAMDELIIYKNSSNVLFTGTEIERENYHGISTAYIYNPQDIISSSDKNMNFYQSLDWFKRVYLPVISAN